MVGAVLGLLVLAAPLLAGCTGDLKVDEPSLTTKVEGTPLMRIAGLVESDTLVPLANATLSILESNQTVQSDAGGRFEFPLLTPRIYTVHASLAGYLDTDLVARPDTNAGALDFVLQAARLLKPFQTSFPFHGFFECGAEALIISGPCDLLVQTALPGQSAFNNESSFSFPLEAGWNTTVIDFVFDATAQPGLDGMRISVRGIGDASQLHDYQQYGRFYDSKSFTARLEPGGNYTDGEATVTSNITAFVVDAYPQSRGYHEACVPTTPLRPAECTLGAGGGLNIEFDMYVTIFYVEPAPAGFTLRQTV